MVSFHGSVDNVSLTLIGFSAAFNSIGANRQNAMGAKKHINSWPLHSPRTSLILVWYQLNYSIVDLIISSPSFFLCVCWKYQIISFSTSLWCSVRSLSLILFSSFYTPLIWVISNTSADQHFYADDIQPFYNSQLLIFIDGWLMLSFLMTLTWIDLDLR